MWLSLRGLRINLVVFLMGSEKPDQHDAVLVLNRDDQAIVIRLDIKDDAFLLFLVFSRART
jgi:hypothetical protein